MAGDKGSGGLRSLTFTTYPPAPRGRGRFLSTRSYFGVAAKWLIINKICKVTPAFWRGLLCVNRCRTTS